MEKQAKEFLTEAGRQYISNKNKWKKILTKKGLMFDEDIYCDSIVKTYNAILNKEIEFDFLGYWYQTFINNSKRDLLYSYHNRDEDVDVIEFLDKEIDEQSPKIIHNDLTKIILLKVRKQFSRKDFELFRIYTLCNMSFEELNKTLNITNSKERIKKIKKWINENIEISDYQ